jgi:hypothetical protein
LLSNTENYLVGMELANPSYWSLARFSLPFNVHIINALILLSTNQIRKDIRRLVTRAKTTTIKDFVSARGPTKTNIKWADSRMALSVVLPNQNQLENGKLKKVTAAAE